MNAYRFGFGSTAFEARGSGALYWPQERALILSDLHLGKAERRARRYGQVLPPYGDHDVLARLEQELQDTDAKTVISLGDGFDDDEAAKNLSPEIGKDLSRLMGARDWIWITGNHDPSAPPFGGRCLSELALSGITLRHMAKPGAVGEISGHYHPKARLALGGAHISRPCFLIDRQRVILPAFGTYTGGLDCRQTPLADLMEPAALAVLTGQSPRALPMPRAKRLRQA
ncbi:MAG: ligase-associated DNA damage response endonuclease PdeM [Mangrovicoccus sp.]|nr:ligase-associated DNA damage response endonuclease PdeM [Mangrovicoccus sp.]